MLDEGLITHCDKSLVTFQADKLYKLCRQLDLNLWEGRRSDYIEKNEFEKTIARMKESHEIEVEYLRSCKLKLLKEVEDLRNDLDRIRSLRSSAPIKNIEQGKNLVLVECGENVSPLSGVSAPTPPPLPGMSAPSPPPL